jgi:hypothetical protein
LNFAFRQQKPAATMTALIALSGWLEPGQAPNSDWQLLWPAITSIWSVRNSRLATGLAMPSAWKLLALAAEDNSRIFNC